MVFSQPPRVATDLAKSREKLLKWLQALHDSGRSGIDEILRVVDMDMLGEDVSDTDTPENYVPGPDTHSEETENGVMPITAQPYAGLEPGQTTLEQYFKPASTKSSPPPASETERL